jgi:protein ImuA
LQPLVDLALNQLPPQVSSSLWRADQLHRGASAAVCPSGFAALDAELPGGGWPTQAVTEILQPHDSWLEWRLLLPALQRCVAHHQIRRGRPLILLGPPWPPHLPGLVQAGLEARDVVWVRSQGPRLLWAAEQVVKAEGAGAVLAWLPKLRPDHLRRLQTLAQACAAPVFVFRPASAQAESSAAPLRVLLSLAIDGPAALQVHVFKRRGPLHAAPLPLTVWPFGLAELVRPVAASSVPSGVSPRSRAPARQALKAEAELGHAVAVADSMLG